MVDTQSADYSSGYAIASTFILGENSNNIGQNEHDEAQVAAITRKLLALSSGDMIFGGLKTDPFRSYPIKFQDYFSAVVDFCKEVVALGPSYFRFVMQHSVLFEAIITYILCVMPNQTQRTKMAMMYHYGGTLSKIAEQLLAQDQDGDAVIIAIANLAVISVRSNSKYRAK